MYYREKADKEVLIKYFIKYRPDLKDADLTTIGQGSRATAFKIGNRVFKVTKDYEDYSASLTIKDDKSKLFTPCYSAVAVEYRDVVRYIIETEYQPNCVGNTKNHGSKTYLLCDRLTSFFRHADMSRSKKELFIDFKESWVSGLNNRMLLRKLFTHYYNLKQETLRLGIPHFDYHTDNVSFGKSFKVIDYAMSSHCDWECDLGQREDETKYLWV